MPPRQVFSHHWKRGRRSSGELDVSPRNETQDMISLTWQHEKRRRPMQPPMRGTARRYRHFITVRLAEQTRSDHSAQRRNARRLCSSRRGCSTRRNSALVSRRPPTPGPSRQAQIAIGDTALTKLAKRGELRGGLFPRGQHASHVPWGRCYGGDTVPRQGPFYGCTCSGEPRTAA